MNDTQRLRHENLLSLCDELENDGVVGVVKKAQYLGMHHLVLEPLLEGGAISDEMAREIEWATNRPVSWLDKDHWGMPDA